MLQTKLGYKLLAVGDSNTKLRKNKTVKTFGLSMAPHKSAGIGNVCPHASVGCIATCLNHQGLASIFESIRLARVKRTKLWYENRELFLSTLREELSKLSGFCAIRLNVFSDIPWEQFGIIDEFPELQFYDYSKNPKRVGAVRPNYWVTYSRSETNEVDCLNLLAMGKNVAVVFADSKLPYVGNRSSVQQLPKLWNGFKVVDGDTTDLRFDDVRGRKFGRVIGLRLKAHSHEERNKAIGSGFAVLWR